MTLSEQFYASFIDKDRWQLYLKGLGMTMEVTVFAAILGLVLGTLACLLNMQQTKKGKRTLLSYVAYIYIDIIRGTPTLIQLMVMWNVIMRSSRNKVLVASLAFGINSGAYIAEILRGGIQSVDSGQMEAGRSLGLNKFQTMMYVVLPQAFKNCFPSLLNEFITLLKETSVASAVGLVDLTRVADQIGNKIYTFMMPLLGAATLYFLVIKILSGIFGIMERKLRESDVR